MEHSTNPTPGPDGSDNLPTIRGDYRHQSLAAQRNRQLGLDLRDAATESEGEAIDLVRYWRILLKRRWTVLGALAIAITYAIVATLLTTPIYRSSASLQIDREAIRIVNVEGMSPTEGAADWGEDFYQTQYELLQSRALAQRTVSQLGLAQSGELDRIRPPSPWAKLSSLLGRGTSVSAPAQKKAAQSEAEIQERERSLTGAFKSGLSIEPVRNSALVRINYQSPDKLFAQRAADAVAEAFIASNLERRFGSSAYAKGYLEDRLQELKLKLEDSERKLVGFAQKEQIVSTGEESASLSELTLGTLNSALSLAKQERIRAESRWRQAQASRGLVLYGDIGKNSIIQSLQTSRAGLMADYQDKLGLYKPAYPLMRQMKGQIDEIDKQIAVEVGNIKSAIQAEYLAALDQELQLGEQMQGVKTDVLDLQSRSIQYNIYKREVDTNRQLYDGLLQRYKEIGIAGGVSTNNVSIVDRAEPGGKVKPDMRRNLTFGALVGLMLGVLLALGFEYLDDTIKVPEDIEKLLGLAMLGIIPRLKAPLTPARALKDPRSAYAEAYRSLCTALQFSTNHGVPRCLLVTSATPSEGKSTTAMVLAQNFALQGKRVLLIDCDLRNPSLHRQLGVKNSRGLTNCLVGGAKPYEIISKTPTENLILMPTGPLPPNPAELLTGPKMLSLLTLAVQKFDQVILDGPPVMGLADAPILANLASGTVLVVEAGETRIAVARNAMKRLWSTRAHVVGALLNKFEARHAGYGYGYGDHKYYAYGGDTAGKLTKR